MRENRKFQTNSRKVRGKLSLPEILVKRVIRAPKAETLSGSEGEK